MQRAGAEYQTALHDFWAARGARFVMVNRWRAPIALGDHAAQPSRLRDLAVCDMSATPRCGLWGLGAEAAFRALGYSIPLSGEAALQNDRALLCRLGGRHFLALSDARASPVTFAASGFAVAPQCCDTAHEHATADLLVVGERARRLMAHFASLDLRDRSFPNLSFAMTMLLSVDALVVRWDIGAIPAFRVFVDASLATTLAEEIDRLLVLLDGAFVGPSALAGLDGPLAALEPNS
jgi:sarcosine oxidase gamma subunit